MAEGDNGSRGIVQGWTLGSSFYLHKIWKFPVWGWCWFDVTWSVEKAGTKIQDPRLQAFHALYTLHKNSRRLHTSKTKSWKIKEHDMKAFSWYGISEMSTILTRALTIQSSMYVHKTCQGRTLTALSRSTQGCQFASLLAVDAKIQNCSVEYSRI